MGLILFALGAAMARSARRFLPTTVAMAVAAAVVLASPGAGAAAGLGTPRSTAVAASPRIDSGELQQLLDQLVAAGVPGAAAWVRDERGVVQAASGVADLRTGRPMRVGLHYRVGSVTKSFVATVVLQLVAEGRLSLADTVERWLPGILPYGDRVTIRQLLNHTSGVPDYFFAVLPTLYGSWQGRFRSWTPQQLVGAVADRPPDFPSGTGSAYSNTAYVLVGLIVEAATGRKLGQELARRILRPIGLRDTFFPVDSAGLPSPKSRGYSLPVSPEGETLAGPLLDFTIYNPSFTWATGNMISTPDDLTRFFRALLGGRLLPPRLLAEMTAVVPTGGLALHDGLGVEILETPGGFLVGKTGAIAGFDTIVLSTPDGRRQFGIMLNLHAFPDAVYPLYIQAQVAIATRLLEEAP